MITARICSQLSMPRATRAALSEMRHQQFRSPEDVRQYQLAKLRRLLKHCGSNVPYYRKLFQQIGLKPEDVCSFRDFASIPPLTKDIIRSNFESLVVTGAPVEDRIQNATGGSTGEPLRFFQDRNYQAWADAARVRGWYEVPGFRSGDTTAVLWGAERDIKKDYSPGERLQAFVRYGEIQLNAFNLSEARQETLFQWCRLLRPRLLRGYVSAVREFATFLHDRRVRIPGLQGVLLCAESVTRPLQEYVEQVFQAPSYNMYGGRELSLIAMECREQCGLHEVSECNYVEFDKVGESGILDAGELLVTNLNNYVMPFLRYRIGDMGVPGPESRCRCGRGLPRIARIIGRTTEVFEFGDGTKVAGEMFVHLMKGFSLREYQFVQKSPHEVVLRVLRESGLSSDEARVIKETYARNLPDSVALRIESVEAFEKTGTGKFRFVYREG